MSISIHERAQSLRRRLNEPAGQIELFAAEAAGVFNDAHLRSHVLWLGYELDGYGFAGLRTLHEALGLPPEDRLVKHVSAYRSQRGQIVEGGQPTGRPFQHFFVEPLAEVVQAANRVQQGASSELRLDFGGHVPNYPTAGLFPSDVFDRLLLGFRAALHLQLGSVPV